MALVAMLTPALLSRIAVEITLLISTGRVVFPLSSSVCLPTLLTGMGTGLLGLSLLRSNLQEVCQIVARGPYSLFNQTSCNIHP